ncbi:uncharacterized protein LOC134274552 [Saccostrea cucullata]|uniref:uncharacterized protein LOC134274552 n=1 Tax=Saccostrea cuccullata TaxID=36930 RepID=UPI002ED1C92B
MGSGFSNQCKVRQCFQCQGDTEFYCNTCKHDLCLKCKERHVFDLDTMHLYVMIYREKYDYVTKQETCKKYPGMFYQEYCDSCKISICFQCTEHRHHQILNSRTTYKTNRQKHRAIIHNIRSETLYNNSCVLAGIKADMKTCHKEISIIQSKMLTKAQKLRNLIDTVICDVKLRHKTFILSLQQQRRKINRNIASIETFEHRSDQSAKRPLKFLMYLKKTTRVHKFKDTPNLTQYALVYVSEDIKNEDVTDLLGEIQIIQRGKRQVRMEGLLKQMSTPVLHRSNTVPGEILYHISCVTPDRAWISDGKNLILINTEGDICIYSSHINGDLLVGMQSFFKPIIARYNDTGQHIKTIQYDNTGQKLYSRPIYITENRNGDVIVSDYWFGVDAVAVTDSRGRHRFSYTGHPSESQLEPRGICTDALSNILVCDVNTNTIQIIDKNGHFLSLILTRQQGLIEPTGLSYDDKTHLLWVGSYWEKKVCVYRYIEKHDYL